MRSRFMIIILFLLFLGEISNVLSQDGIRWSRSEAKITTEDISVVFSSRKPKYIIWHNKESEVRYFFEIWRVIEFLDENSNGVLDAEDEVYRSFRMMMSDWNFTFDEYQINEAKVLVVKLSSKFAVKGKNGPKDRWVRVEITNYVSSKNINVDGFSLMAQREVGISLRISRWPWHSGRSCLGIEMIYGVQACHHRKQKVCEGKERINVEVRGGFSKMYANISKRVSVDANEAYANLSLDENKVIVTMPQYNESLRYNLTIGVFLEQEVISFRSGEYSLIAGDVVAVGIIVVLSIVVSKKKIDRTMDILS